MPQDEPPRPGPTHARTRGVDALTPARRVVLDVLGAHEGAVTVAEVAEATGLHLNTVREHLEALVDSGLAIRGRLAPQGRGRPASTYEYSPQAETLSPTYGLMTNAIVEYLAATFGSSPQVREHAYRAGRLWGEEIVSRGLVGDQDGGDAVEEALSLLDEAGFEPSVHTAPEPSEEITTGAEVRLWRCPVLSMARQYPSLICAAHHGMVDQVLAGQGEERHTRVEAFVNEGYCSLFLDAPQGHTGLVVGHVPRASAAQEPVTGPRR